MLRNLLKKHWGYDSFRPLQEEAIQCVLDRRDSLVVMPTGGGKSLCYQIPALCLDGVAIVVSPLISLMKDQVDALRQIGIPAAALNSSTSPDEQRTAAREVMAGRLKILYMAPERLLSTGTLEWLSNQSISMIAIDEAHCISSWGHDFRPEYRALSQVRKRFPGASLHGFTATATEQVRNDIAAQLKLVEPKILVGNFHRKNLIYHVERRTAGHSQIASVMDRYRDSAGIIYAITRDKVEGLSQLLNAHGYRTRPYHAGLPEATRTTNQEALINDEIEAIVATVAFGMGIDKSNVRYVIHAEMPKSLEGYQQESGRAGRDGLDSECWLFYSGQDFMTWQRIVDKSGEESKANAARSLKEVTEYCTSVICRHRQLVEHFGQKLTVDCQACDVCLGKLAVEPDALVKSQKILSCVVRCKESFGADHISKVLQGSNDAKVTKYGHEKLSTWGLLKEFPKPQIRNWIDQLTGQGFLEAVGEFRTLTVTLSGRVVLRGEQTPILSRAVEAAPARPARGDDDWEGVDRGLFEALRGLRRGLAAEAGVAAFIVFSDATLRDLARRRPTSLSDLLKVAGVGQRKSEAYGNAVISLIEKYCEEHNVGPSAFEQTRPKRAGAAEVGPSKSALGAFDFFDKGLSVTEVALKLERAPSTVHGYFAEYIQAKKITDASRWVLPSEIAAIEAAAKASEDGRLKPIHEALGGEFSYETIRLVLTCMRNRDVG